MVRLAWLTAQVMRSSASRGRTWSEPMMPDAKRRALLSVGAKSHPLMVLPIDKCLRIKKVNSPLVSPSRAHSSAFW